MSEPTFAHRWAIHALSGREDAPLEQVRAELLRELSEESFLLSDEKHEAAMLLGASPQTEPKLDRFPNLRAVRERAIESDIAEFGRDYFRLAPQLRRRRWEWLKQECRDFPELTERLALWRGGLDLEYVAPANADEADRLLIADLAALVPQTPAKRAEMRSTLVGTFRGKDRFQFDLVRFGGMFPQWAALAPEVADLVRAAKAPVPRAPVMRPAAPVTSNSIGSSGMSWRTWLGVFIMLKVFFFGMKSCSQLESSANRPTRSNFVSQPRREFQIPASQVEKMSPELKRVLGVNGGNQTSIPNGKNNATGTTAPDPFTPPAIPQPTPGIPNPSSAPFRTPTPPPKTPSFPSNPGINGRGTRPNDPSLNRGVPNRIDPGRPSYQPPSYQPPSSSFPSRPSTPSSPGPRFP